MFCREFCTLLLKESRRDLLINKEAKEALKGMYTNHGSLANGIRYFWVYDRFKHIIWEGSTCCAYHARSRAIDTYLNFVG